MSGASQYITAELRKFAVECLNARTAVSRARTIAEVKRAADVQPGAVIRQLVHSLSDYRALQIEAEEKALQIARRELEQLARTSLSARDKAVGRFRQSVLHPLRGDFATTYRIVERELRRLERQKQ